MKILLTGANGYIGMRLLPQLLALGHQVVCAVRDESRFSIDKEIREQIDVIEIDLLDAVVPNKIPIAIDVAYFLVHSMSSSTQDFDKKEEITALNFNAYMAQTLKFKKKC